MNKIYVVKSELLHCHRLEFLKNRNLHLHEKHRRLRARYIALLEL